MWLCTHHGVCVHMHITLSAGATDLIKSEVLIMTEHNEVILGYQVICEERNFWHFRDRPWSTAEVCGSNTTVKQSTQTDTCVPHSYTQTYIVLKS